MHRPAKAAGLRQMRGGGQQHSGMTIVAAGVHHARITGLVADVTQFSNRQRVHIGAQADNRPGAVLQGGHHPGPCQPAMHLQAKRCQ